VAAPRSSDAEVLWHLQRGTALPADNGRAIAAGERIIDLA
jgi:hypothetical protein